MSGSRHPLGWVAPEAAAPIAAPVTADPAPEMVNVTQLPPWAQAYIGELEERAFRLEQELVELRARFAP